MKVMKYLIVGLGNPGEKYVGTRHNAGFRLIDWLATELAVPNFTSSSQGNALTSEVSIVGRKTFLVKPETFMNKSGEAVRQLADYFNIPPERILIIYDDVDLALADIRLAYDRGSGGHRGVQSVISELKTQCFYRLRIGISPTNEAGEPVKQTVGEQGINPFVMGQFSETEVEKLEATYPDIEEGIKHWIESGQAAAMNYLN
jgi:PTH1 family peptidyl-tRNA hydrolase